VSRINGTQLWKRHWTVTVLVLRCCFEHGHTVALNHWQLRTVSDLKCRQLLLEASGSDSCNLFIALPSTPFCPLPVYYSNRRAVIVRQLQVSETNL
jgi:hypothetical protein